MSKYILTGKGEGTYDTNNPLTDDNLFEVGGGGDSKKPAIDPLTSGVVRLDNFEGRISGFDTALTYTTYVVDSNFPKVVGGFHRLLVNLTEEPIVYLEDGTTQANEITCSTFHPGVNMELIVESPDGIRVDYYYLYR